MMDVEIRSTRPGKCEQCGNVGLLLRIPVLAPQSAQWVENAIDLTPPCFTIQHQCLGCVEARRTRDVLDADVIE